MSSHLVNFFFNLSFHGWPLICHVDRQWPPENTSCYYGITEAEQKMEKTARNCQSVSKPGSWINGHCESVCRQKYSYSVGIKQLDLLQLQRSLKQKIYFIIGGKIGVHRLLTTCELTILTQRQCSYMERSIEEVGAIRLPGSSNAFHYETMPNCLFSEDLKCLVSVLLVFPLSILWKSMWNVESENQPEKNFLGRWVTWGPTIGLNLQKRLGWSSLENVQTKATVSWSDRKSLVKDWLKSSPSLIWIKPKFFIWKRA